MIEGNVFALLEGETIGTVGGIEHAVDEYAVHIEIGFYLVLAHIEQLLLHLCRVVETVVGLEVECRTLGLTGKSLNLLGLGIGLGCILTDEVLQKGIDILWCLGHRLLQRVRRVVGITHNLGLLGTQLGNLADDGVGVVLASAVGTMNAGLKDLLAQLAIVEGGQNGLLGGVYNDDGIGSLLAQVLSVLGALGDVSLRESCQIFFLVNPHHSIIGGIG